MSQPHPTSSVFLAYLVYLVQRATIGDMGREAQTTKPGGSSNRRAGPARAAAQPAAPDARRPRSPSFPDLVHDALSTVPDSTRDDFVRSVTIDETPALDSTLWGRGPTTNERRAAALQNLGRTYAARRAVIESALTRSEAAELLDVSEQAVLDRLKAGDLLGLKKGREWRLPTWQFSADTAQGFVPGIDAIRRVFPGGVVSLTEWMTTPNVELDGATPAEALVAERFDDVDRVARTATAAAW